MTTENNKPETIEDPDLKEVSGGPVWEPYLKGKHLPSTLLHRYETVSGSVVTTQANPPASATVRNAEG